MPTPAHPQPTVTLEEPPLPHERCLLLRLRSGLTQTDAANYLGYSKFWYGAMERGAVPLATDVLEYWNER